MKFDIITIFPQIFDSYFSESIIGRAQKAGLVKIVTHDLRRWTKDKHKTVDDKPYGGGAGMVMMPGPIFKAVKALKKPAKQKRRIILFSAKGKKFTQKDAQRLAGYGQLIMICGRYEGVDERVAKYLADEEISVGEYVLTGGEIPAMIVVDAIARLQTGVLGNQESLKEESFSQENIAEYPQYTRPENFKGWKVPKVLLSGNHAEIEKWRKNNLKKNV
ncbi:MAG: tRNA (guanosine(37)-N1)-methyltransferase TrmD [Candidatus Portnoybacteria bacterium CG10_big_fil_rev_8_21_14_0_10_44_7]|uniref:tRNA (guanine-N(1)-)-methyltransferase n=1 Tax=Candidatus Portnoybacteria bacterium CG10_big_fil_rev_8_21_14_0_10_44_7 TaxID=1974816 RepID=A0A2M8KI73_9BACT|nr:MAG: tRNA (guanosine(37)-N1)-methyltransferase TrmD [Candidatus Portnoybacteria bacterium CG10_big_fil_rev_8_21_14_0_10_44_7]